MYAISRWTVTTRRRGAAYSLLYYDLLLLILSPNPIHRRVYVFVHRCVKLRQKKRAARPSRRSGRWYNNNTSRSELAAIQWNSGPYMCCCRWWMKQNGRYGRECRVERTDNGDEIRRRSKREAENSRRMAVISGTFGGGHNNRQRQLGAILMDAAGPWIA